MKDVVATMNHMKTQVLVTDSLVEMSFHIPNSNIQFFGDENMSSADVFQENITSIVVFEIGGDEAVVTFETVTILTPWYALGVHCRELVAESLYKERCIVVDNGQNWAKYMSISGSPDDEYNIITLQYTEEGLLTVDENREGHAAAFGDDIAIECLATEFKREIYVVQAHGSDAMVDEDNCVFFLPHRPRSEICGPPFFLFMKGTSSLVAPPSTNARHATSSVICLMELAVDILHFFPSLILISMSGTLRLTRVPLVKVLKQRPNGATGAARGILYGNIQSLKGVPKAFVMDGITKA
ncbi:SSRP1 domain-containing protein [Cynara cardunculus var. scolymus]|uniref:SSRP1 domain-containing protein n=1 Tax=Cynara cardunculus var. scolymus TaxID=59895 RepID=A0A118JKP2_CYNCS|nr:SSRP1 domain-containing protein [Cynara cardunculus var. scolymus]